MDLRSMLGGIRARAPWQSAGRPMLLAAGFTIHQGYEKTINTALKERPDAARNGRLSLALVEHLIAGEKRIRFVKLKPGERSTLQAWVATKRIAANELTNAFPGVASTSSLAKFQNQPPSSVGSIALQSGIAALFTAARSYEDRVEVPRSQLKDGVATYYDKLIGVRQTMVQTYDAIWIPPAGDFACIVTDMPGGVPKQFPEESEAYLQAQLRQKLGRQIEFYNLWKAIDGLYAAPDGRLVDYGFSVAGQSVNHHKSRKRGQCLRKAVYDSAGAAAVGDDLELFKVALQWTVRDKEGNETNPEILLPGMAADLNRPNPIVGHAIFRDGLSSNDLEFVAQKLRPHME